MDKCKKQPDIDLTESGDCGKCNGLDLIRKQDAIDIASGYCHPANIAKELMKLPSAESKTGKWIVWGGMDVPENHGRHKCSECGEFALLRYEKPLRKEVLSDFCPNCGAKMKGEEDE